LQLRIRILDVVGWTGDVAYRFVKAFELYYLCLRHFFQSNSEQWHNGIEGRFIPSNDARNVDNKVTASQMNGRNKKLHGGMIVVQREYDDNEVALRSAIIWLYPSRDDMVTLSLSFLTWLFSETLHEGYDLTETNRNVLRCVHIRPHRQRSQVCKELYDNACHWWQR